MQPFRQRQAFLVSAIVHSLILAVLSGREPSRPSLPQRALEASAAAQSKVFLPPREVLRQLGLATVPNPRPPKPFVPSPRSRKDRISVGSPSAERATGPLVLRREDDLTAVPRGLPGGAPTASGPPRASAAAEPTTASRSPLSTPGLRLPPGLGTLSRGEEATAGPRDPSQPVIGSALRDLERRLSGAGPLGIAAGVGRQMGPLFFDPEGADFTAWINHFKNEVYRNWIVPQAALLGFRGNVDLEFVVARDGTLTSLRLVSSSGTAALDRSAQNALMGSRLLTLPRDYAPSEITMHVRFIYG